MKNKGEGLILAFSFSFLFVKFVVVLGSTIQKNLAYDKKKEYIEKP